MKRQINWNGFQTNVSCKLYSLRNRKNNTGNRTSSSTVHYFYLTHTLGTSLFYLIRIGITDWWKKCANTSPRAQQKWQIQMFQLPEEFALWLTDKGFDEEVEKAFIGMFVWIRG